MLRLTWALLPACEGDAEAARREADQEVLRWAELFAEVPVWAAEIYSVLGDTASAAANRSFSAIGIWRTSASTPASNRSWTLSTEINSRGR